MMRFQLVLLTHIGEPQFRRGPRVFRKLWCLQARSCNHSLPQISFSTGADRETFFASAGRKPPSCEDWAPPLAALWDSRTWGFLSSPAVVALASAEISRTCIYSDLIGTL